MRYLIILCALLLSVLSFGQVQNGDFELGFFNWNVDYASSGIYSYGGTTFQDANGGNLLVGIGEPGAGVVILGGLDQTVSDVLGQTYQLSFDMGTLDVFGNNNLDVTWNGVSVYNAAATYSATNTLTTANFYVTGTGSDSLEFVGWNNSLNLTGLDNVSLTPTSPTPEPVTMTFAVAGLIAAIVRRRSN